MSPAKRSLAEGAWSVKIRLMHEHDDTGDKLEHAYFCYLADKFEREPELLEIPLATISLAKSMDPASATCSTASPRPASPTSASRTATCSTS